MTIPPRPPYPPDPPTGGPDPDDGGGERGANDAEASSQTGPDTGSLTSKIFGPAGRSGGAAGASGSAAGAGAAGGSGGSSGASGGASASGGDRHGSGTPKGAAWAIIAVVAVLALAIGTFLGMTVFGGSGDSKEPVASGSTQTSAPGRDRSHANGAGSADSANPQPSESESSGTQSPSASPTESPGETVSTFQSPSTNIACSIDDGTVRCDIMKKKYDTPDPPDDCQGKFGHTFFANSDESRLECAEDSVRVDDAHVLEYGETTSTEGVTCDSDKTGMTCTVDATGHGFTIAKANYTLF